MHIPWLSKMARLESKVKTTSTEEADPISVKLMVDLTPETLRVLRSDADHYKHADAGYRHANSNEEEGIVGCPECRRHWDLLHEAQPKILRQHECMGCSMGRAHTITYPKPLPGVTEVVEAMVGKPEPIRYGSIFGDYKDSGG